MMQERSLFSSDALARSVPRYTSYPTAPHFEPGVGAETYRRWLGALDPTTPLSLYLHIPYCDDLCWFCACRTQGARRYGQVERYLSHLVREIEMIAAELSPGHPISHIHFGGGSPTILRPEDMRRLMGVLRRNLPALERPEIAVEIDPRDITEEKLDALVEIGLSRASIGVQDFDPAIQRAIGRHQGWEMTRDVVTGLRARGVAGINIDLLYGLPGQSIATLSETIEKVTLLDPDRLALFGYAHVPWMAKRQKLIDPAILPGPAARSAQSRAAAGLLVEAGYEPIGIDHFAKPHDALARAARRGGLRRNFQGYTTDQAGALIGFGASAIGCLPQGYVQNEASTAAYQLLIEAERPATRRGRTLTLDDRMRRDVIERILCDFSVEWAPLRARYGDFIGKIRAEAEALAAAAPPAALEATEEHFRIAPAWQSHARLIAAEFDAYLSTGNARHSLAL